MQLSQALHALQSTGHRKVMNPQGDHCQELGKSDTPGNPVYASAVLSFSFVTFSNGIGLESIFLMGLNQHSTQQPLELKSITPTEAAATVPVWMDRSQQRLGRKAMPTFTNKMQKESDSSWNGKMNTKIKKRNQNKIDNS